MSNVGFGNDEEARRASRVIRRVEAAGFGDIPSGFIGGTIVLPGAIYSDADYRYAVVTWLNGETKTYTDDTGTVLVCSHGTADPPAEGVPIFCTFHGIKDGYAVYCASGGGEYVRWIKPTASEPNSYGNWPGVVRVKTGTDTYTDGDAIRLTFDDVLTTSSLERLFVSGNCELGTLHGTVTEDSTEYPLYHARGHQQDTVTVCVDGVETDRCWQIPGWIVGSSSCAGVAGAMQFNRAANSGFAYGLLTRY